MCVFSSGKQASFNTHSVCWPRRYKAKYIKGRLSWVWWNLVETTIPGVNVRLFMHTFPNQCTSPFQNWTVQNVDCRLTADHCFQGLKTVSGTIFVSFWLRGENNGLQQAVVCILYWQILKPPMLPPRKMPGIWRFWNFWSNSWVVEMVECPTS